MGLLNPDAVVHWSIPVNDLVGGENSTVRFWVWTCRPSRQFADVLLPAQQPQHTSLPEKEPLLRTIEQDGRLHHAFDVGTAMFDRACKLFHRLGIEIHEPADYRPCGFFSGRQLFVLDPSGNRIELRDASWKSGMPTPTYEEIVKSRKHARNSWYSEPERHSEVQ